jgi:thymidylate synthase ThyX
MRRSKVLSKEFFNRETSIKATVICDSISEKGIRLTTFEIEYPRIVMSEFNTHRSVSKNSSSSRAIPVSKMLEHTQNINLKPIYFGSKKSGMQAGDELDGNDLINAKLFWEAALFDAITWATELDELGVAKEVCNRLVEPFQLVKVVCTATDWDNFFNLRLHPDSDPNICMLAYKMYEAMQESEPIELKAGEWHLPFVNVGWNGKGEMCYADDDFNFVELEQAIKLSAASCASVSYRTEGMTLEKADKIFDMLIKAEVVHSSPLEHCATPVSKEVEIENSDYLTVGFINKASDPNTWEDGVTHMNKQGELCSGNLRGFIQYRHLLPNNTNWEFDFGKRVELFN